MRSRGPELQTGHGAGLRTAAQDGWTERRVAGDADDVEAAVIAAAARGAIAIERTEPADADGVTVYRLRTPAGERGELRAQPLQGEEVLLRAKIGIFGDAQREAKLVDRMAKRLRQLRGRNAAPIHW